PAPSLATLRDRGYFKIPLLFPAAKVESRMIRKVTPCRAPQGGEENMAKNIYVGNLVWDATADDLLELFGQHGKVTRAQVITDRETGRSRGFGFVEMENDAEAQKAIEALNGFDHNGRPLTVN